MAKAALAVDDALSDRASMKPGPFVLVLMPFDQEFNNAYLLCIKPACTDAGAYCERVDEQIFTENIVGRILNQIAKADIIVADMSGQNANVFYETGYAHALGKTVILLTKNTDDIPFDLKQFPHIVYGADLVSLKKSLTEKVTYFIGRPTQKELPAVWNLQFHDDGKPIPDGAEVQTYLTSTGNLSIILDVHNPNPTRFAGQHCAVGLIAPFLVREASSSERSVPLGDGTYLTPLPFLKNIFPQGWFTFRFDLKPHTHKFEIGDRVSMTLRLFSDSGVRDIPFIAVVARASRIQQTSDF